MSDGTHAKYSPSQLPRIMGCAGSTTVNQSTPETIYAREGTLCHDIIAGHLEQSTWTLDEKRLEIFKEEDRDELGEAIQDCLDYAFRLLSQHSGDVHVFVEKRVSMNLFVPVFNCPALVEVAGTADLNIFAPQDRIMHIVDWKFGKGVEVWPSSEQLKGYGGASIATRLYKKYGLTNIPYEDMILHIGQPRLHAGERFKTYETTLIDIIYWVGNELVPALRLCESEDPPFVPSEKACMWCAIKATCRARYEKAQKTAEKVFAAFAQLPHEVGIEDLVAFRTEMRDLKTYIKAIENHIIRTLMNGKEVPGLKMVEGKSNRVWADPKAFVQWCNANYPDYEIFEPKLLSPSKAEKLFKRKIAGTDEFQALIHKPDGAPTLVIEEDPRPAIQYADASDVFKDFIIKED